YGRYPTMSKPTKKEIKDKSTLAKAATVAKSKAMSAAIVQQRKDAVETAKEVATSTAPVMAVVVDNTKPTSEINRYDAGDAEYGFTVDDQKKLPKDVQFIPNAKHYALASVFSTGSDDAIAAAIKDIGRDMANIQGKIQCALVGLACRLQLEGEIAVSHLNAFI